MEQKELMQKIFEKLVSIEKDLSETKIEIMKEIAMLEGKMKVRFNELEQNLYRIERMEKRQDKTSARLEILEADVSIVQAKLG